MMDDHEFLVTSAIALESNQLDQLDAKRLAEELRNQAGRDKVSIDSAIEKTIEHLLKLDYIDKDTLFFTQNNRIWRCDAVKQQKLVKRYVEKMPSLKRYIFDEAQKGSFQKMTVELIVEISGEYGKAFSAKDVVPYDLRDLVPGVDWTEL